MRTLIILITIVFTACSASKPSVSNLESEKLAKEYRVNPNEAVLELTIQEVEQNEGSYLLKANVEEVIKIGFGFKQVNENQVINIRTDLKLAKNDKVFALTEFYQQQSGPEYSLKRTF